MLKAKINGKRSDFLDIVSALFLKQYSYCGAFSSTTHAKHVSKSEDKKSDDEEKGLHESVKVDELRDVVLEVLHEELTAHGGSSNQEDLIDNNVNMVLDRIVNRTSADTGILEHISVDYRNRIAIGVMPKADSSQVEEIIKSETMLNPIMFTNMRAYELKPMDISDFQTVYAPSREALGTQSASYQTRGPAGSEWIEGYDSLKGSEKGVQHRGYKRPDEA